MNLLRLAGFSQRKAGWAGEREPDFARVAASRLTRHKRALRLADFFPHPPPTMFRRAFCASVFAFVFCVFSGGLNAQQAPVAGSAPGADSTGGAATQAVAAVASGAADPQPSDLVSHVVDLVLEAFGVGAEGNTWRHYLIAGLILVASYVFRKLFTRIVLAYLQRLTSRTKSTLDDKLFGALHGPVGAAIVVFGAVLAIKVLKLSPEAEAARVYLQTVAFAVLTLWFFLSAFSTVIDHLHEVAKTRGLSVAAFMPWIKKALFALILILGVLLVAERLGADVKAFLAGLGIGGLAFALAAQDTLSNVFGSVVVAVDQPFRVGEYVQIGTHMGTVEEIGLRSTKLRTPQRTVIAIPNRTVANEAINNFGRMTQRRIEQTIGVTYNSKPEQIEGLLEDIRDLLKNDSAVHQDFIAVNFLNFGAFSLDIQIIFFAAETDLRKSFALRERINLALMRLVLARGLSFAFPTQTVEFAGPVAERLATARNGGLVPPVL